MAAAAKQNGEFVHPNPCFAFDDAAQKDNDLCKIVTITGPFPNSTT